MRNLIVLFSCLIYISTAAATEFKLFKKGTQHTFIEDTHCINNEGAKALVTKLSLCGKECEVKLVAHIKACQIEKAAIDDAKKAQEEKLLAIISIKDETIMQVQRTALDSLESSASNWWKYTVVAVGAAVVGAGITSGVYYLLK